MIESSERRNRKVLLCCVLLSILPSVRNLDAACASFKIFVKILSLVSFRFPCVIARLH